MENANTKSNIICLTPVYNDWPSFSILLNQIAIIQNNSDLLFEVVAVNDGSFDEYNSDDFNTSMPIEIVNLKLNIGHQRAIATGLQYIHDSKTEFDYIIVLDSDGEDKPEHIPELVAKCKITDGKKIIFAQRQKRQESILFKTGYFFYKKCFTLLTGQHINFGNFSCIPKRHLKRVVIQPNLWNHYSGSIIQSKIPIDKVMLDRGKRYAGTSKMNFSSLVLHGLSSISVYFDTLSIRILKLSIYCFVACIFAIIIILYKKFVNDTAIPGWASNLLLVIFSIVLQLSSVTLIVLLMQLSSRKNIKKPSSVIYKHFVENVKQLNK